MSYPPIVSITVDTKGFQDSLKKLGEHALTMVGIALFEEATDIMEKPNGARDQAPVDVGTLSESGFVNQPVIEGNNVTVTLGFGGASSAYAHRQHEELTWKHPKHGKAKYLEDPMNEARDGFDERVGKRINDVLAEMGK